MAYCEICDETLGNDELTVVEFPLTVVKLNPDQFFPGYCFMYYKEHREELFELEALERADLIEEVSALAGALNRAFFPDKINYQLLGNMVPHIHWHIIPRFSSDPLWPNPIWSKPHEPRLLTDEEYGATVDKIRNKL